MFCCLCFRSAVYQKSILCCRCFCKPGSGKPLPSARFTSSGSPCSTAAHDSVLGGASETVNSSATTVSIQLSRPQPDS